MTNVLIKHPVKDFRAWKSVFDNFADQRRSGGEKSHKVLHLQDNPNDLVLLFEWDSVDNARRFLDSQELKEAMGNAGVTGAPEIQILEEAFHGTV